MTKVNILSGTGLASRRPFRIEIHQKLDTVWIRALHQTGTPTVVAAFQRTHFEEWVSRTRYPTVESATLTGRRSRGGRAVELRLRRSMTELVLTFVDDSGTTTNATLVSVADWTRFLRDAHPKLQALGA